MARSAATVRWQKGRPLRSGVKPATSAKLASMLNDYKTATDQHAIIVRYLTAAIEVLPKPECELLLEFAEIAKKHCERLHRMIKRHLARTPRAPAMRRTHDLRLE
jgi:hypothetical protein